MGRTGPGLGSFGKHAGRGRRRGARRIGRPGAGGSGRRGTGLAVFPRFPLRAGTAATATATTALLQAAQHLAQRFNFAFVTRLLAICFLQKLEDQFHLIERITKIIDDNFDILNGLTQGSGFRRARGRNVDARLLAWLKARPRSLRRGRRWRRRGDRGAARSLIVVVLLLVTILGGRFVLFVAFPIVLAVTARFDIIVASRLPGVIVIRVLIGITVAFAFGFVRSEDGLVIVGAERFRSGWFIGRVEARVEARVDGSGSRGGMGPAGRRFDGGRLGSRGGNAFGLFGLRRVAGGRRGRRGGLIARSTTAPASGSSPARTTRPRRGSRGGLGF
jgi:hypothetical protein